MPGERHGSRKHSVSVTRLRRVTDEAGTFVVLQDPEGNEFCVG